MSLSLETRIKHGPDIVMSDLDGAAVLLNPNSNEYFGLNRVGSRIWGLIEEERSIGDIIQTLQSEFDVELTTCEKEVFDFVSESVDAKVVETTA
ncbi:MAG: PqqD family peptide modification chaperone [Verrucomicrobiota bacterium]